jgi:phosphatidylserine/phosphatidylglycerophosphate/cardiolipin synthase-like enzyme
VNQVRRLLLAFVATLLVTGVLAATPAEAGKYKPPPGGHFNVPRSGAKQYRIQGKVADAIAHARRGSVIKISLFSWDRKILAKQIIRARNRGVRVQILLNNHQVTPAQRMLHRRLGTNRWKKNFAYECRDGCRSRGENLHSKFFLFSHTGAARYVVMTGSTNFTMNSAANQYNDMYVRNDNRTMYEKFVKVFKAMRRDKLDRPTYWVQNIGKYFQLQVTPFPNFGPDNDPIMRILNKVRCQKAWGGAGNGRHRTIVRVTMHAWNGRRGTYLAKKIRSLYANGCDIRLMYGYAGEKVRATFATKTKRGYVPVHTTGYDTDEDGFIDLYTHQKELLISGHYGSDHSKKMVVTGSSNWQDEGLRGDEEIFLIKRGAAYKDYARNFNWMYKYRSSRVKYIPYGTTRIAAGQSLMRFDPSTELQRFGPAWESD